jgi:hypothetical protein
MAVSDERDVVTERHGPTHSRVDTELGHAAADDKMRDTKLPKAGAELGLVKRVRALLANEKVTGPRGQLRPDFPTFRANCQAVARRAVMLDDYDRHARRTRSVLEITQPANGIVERSLEQWLPLRGAFAPQDRILHVDDKKCGAHMLPLLLR